MLSSLRSSLFALWLPGMVIAIVLIAGYGTYTAYKRDTASAQVRLQSLATSFATDVDAELDRAMDAARTLAHTMAAMKGTNTAGANTTLSRNEVNAIVREVLKRNPSFLAVYTAWEPNAFDGNDSAHRNEAGHDSSGRFSPYWSRLNGKIQLEPNIGYDTQGIGDYYQIPKTAQRECILEPYSYPVQGKNLLITSVSVPILIGETFYGICAVDITLDFLQGMTDKADVFDHAGKITIVSNQGKIVAMTDRPEFAMLEIGKVFSAFQRFAEPSRQKSSMNAGTDGKDGIDGVAASSNQAQPQNIRRFHASRHGVFLENDTLFAFSPMAIGFVETPWSVMVSVPENVVITPLTAVTFTQALMAVVVIAALTLTIWLFLSRMLQAVNALQAATETFATGNLEAIVAVGGSDELSEVGASFNRMARKIRDMMTELQHTQSLNMQTQRDLDTMLTMMNVGVAVNIRNQYVFTNPALTRMLGFSADEFRQMPNIEDLIHPDDRERIHQRHNERLQGIAAHSEPIEVRYRHSLGRYVWVQVSGLLISYQGEQSTLATFVDITTRKQSEEAVHKSEQNIRMILEGIVVGVILNSNDRILFVNNALCQMLGYGREEFLQKQNIWDIVHPDDFALLRERYEARMRGDRIMTQSAEIRYLHKQGHIVWAEIAGTSILYEGEQTALATLTDITERKKAEQEVRNVHKNQQRILETMGVGVAVTRGEKPLFVNNALLHLTGYSREDLLDFNLYDIIHSESRAAIAERGRARLRGEDVPERYEMQILNKEGQWRWAEVHAFIIDYEHEPAVIASLVDVTERKAAMGQLTATIREKEELIAEKDELLAELDRRGNAALRSVIQGQEDERHRIAQELHDGVGHLLSIVKIGLSSFQEEVQTIAPERLDEFGRFLELYDRAVHEVRAVSHQLMPATLRKMGLKSALQDLATMLTLSTGLRVDTSFDVLDSITVPLGIEVETSLYRIIQELVQNTLKYANAKTVSIQLLRHNDTLLCIYEDDGIGFYTTQQSSGIGLRNITNRASLLNGTAEFDSSPGNGIVATIAIPLRSENN